MVKDTKFKKGNIAWNKGLKGIHLNRKTEFKKGSNHFGENHPSWKGGVQIMTNDCVYVWFNGSRIRRPVKVLLENNIEIPENYVVFHKDYNKHNDNIENLEVISRAELLKRNLRAIR